MKRAEILEAAKVCVCGNREQDYGSPERNFETIAILWTTYLRAIAGPCEVVPIIDSKDVAAMMAIVKIARISSGHGKEDNWIDLAGYAACGGEIESNQEG